MSGGVKEIEVSLGYGYYSILVVSSFTWSGALDIQL